VSDLLRVERDGPNDAVAHVTLTRPDVHNAFNASLIAELRRAFTALAREAPTDLRAVVDALGLEPPLLLVAHGVGGLVAVTAMQQDPDLAGGLLLLDAAGPGYPQAALDALAGARRAAAERDTWARLLRPESNREHLDGQQAFAQAQAFPSLGPVPMLALTHSIAEHAPGTPPRRQADLESAWEAGQNGWLALAAAGRLERVDLAGHDIAADQPELVVMRVRELLPAG